LCAQIDLALSASSMLHGVMLNGTLGVISGLGNIAPKSLVNVFELFQAGKIEEAKRAQVAISLAGELELKGGVPGMRVSGETGAGLRRSLTHTRRLVWLR
jgi:dihydrodipicolinate synthase/N-acetylneuraminate lyase